jgi:hypothetical protein
MHRDDLKRQLADLQHFETEAERQRESRRWFIQTLAVAGIGGVLLPGLHSGSAEARFDDCKGGEHTCGSPNNTCGPNLCAKNTCTENICSKSNTCSENKCNVNQCDENICAWDTGTSCSKEQPNKCNIDVCYVSDSTCS